MKKSILALAASTLIIGSIATSCNTPAEKVEKAQTNVQEANQDLEKANDAYKLEIESYRKETADKIAANDKSIADFNLRIENQKQDAKVEYKKQIAELEQKNSDMKKKMDDYKADSKVQWEIFKTEFSHDMDELGKAFKGLTIKNNK